MGFVKDLLNLGREYPLGYPYFQKRLHQAFSQNVQLRDEVEIRKSIEKAEYVKQEVEALLVELPSSPPPNA